VDRRVDQVHRCLRALSGYCADPEGSMAALMAELHHDAVWQDADSDFDDAHHGRDAVAARVWVVLAPYERFAMTADSAESRGEAVVASVRATYRYRTELASNGFPDGDGEQSWWQIWLIRDDLVHYVRDVSSAAEIDDAMKWVEQR
jgi:hypothetical protein